MTTSIGLDFGTTNSAVAVADARGDARLARFRTGDGFAHTSPSVLYFAPVARGTTSAVVRSGHAAVSAYLDAETKGRFVQSLKSYLPDPNFDGTTVGRRKQTLEELIALMLRQLRDEAAADLGVRPGRVVVGRPVTYAETPDDRASTFAVTRMRQALAAAGFEDVAFEYEPIAAAYAYERRLSRDEVILVADFGGGTSDFTVMTVGPEARRRQAREVLGSAGLPIGGDIFDRQIVRHVVAPRLGAGSHYTSSLQKRLPVPAWPYAHLERWHHLSFLRSAETIEMLERIAGTASPAGRIEGLLNVIEEDQGYQLHRAVHAAKVGLSHEDEVRFAFDAGPVRINQPVSRAEFTGWIGEQLSEMAATVDGLLLRADVPVARVDRVFLTGGSSFVPAVRQIFIDRFGIDRIVGGEELTSVATGLALRAAEQAA